MADPGSSILDSTMGDETLPGFSLTRPPARPAAPWSGAVAQWALLVLLTLCPAIGFALAHWL